MIYCIFQDTELLKVQAGKMLIGLDSELKSDVANIMKEIVTDSKDQLSTVGHFFYMIFNTILQ